MITITQTAADQILSQAQQGGMEKLAFRVAARQDDSGAFEYGIGFDEATDDDISVSSEGINVIVSPESEQLLRGATIDYVEIEAGQHHFIFLNPNDPNYVPPNKNDNELNS